MPQAVVVRSRLLGTSWALGGDGSQGEMRTTKLHTQQRVLQTMGYAMYRACPCAQ